MKAIISPRALAVAMWAVGCAAFAAFAVKAIANGAAAATSCVCSMGAW